MGTSPAHFQAGFQDSTSSQQLGTAAHMAILEPEKFERTCVVYPGKRDPRAAKWLEFESEAARTGKLIVTKTERENAQRMCDAVRKNARARELLSHGESEKFITWDYPVAGGEPIACRGTLDKVYAGHWIADLKSTQCAAPGAFRHSAAKYGYFGQGSWYDDGWFAHAGERLPFFFVAVESHAPFITQVYSLDDQTIARGRQYYLTLLGRLDYCRKTNRWPGYSDAPEAPLEYKDPYDN